MRSLFLVFLISLNVKPLFGQIEHPHTEICIIGTIHTGNKYINQNTLYKLLKQHNPDIILWEQGTDFKRVFGLRTAFFLKIAKSGIEQLALQKYSKRYKDIKIFGFDTVFSRKKYIREYINSNKAFFDSMKTVKMTFADSLLYAEYTNKRDHYYNLFTTKNLFELNKPDIIDMARQLKLMEQNHIVSIGKRYIADSLLVTKWENERIFWILRNNYMTNKIRKYSRQFEGKKIIILTGLNHKYYLIDKLRELESGTIKIIDIQED